MHLETNKKEQRQLKVKFLFVSRPMYSWLKQLSTIISKNTYYILKFRGSFNNCSMQHVFTSFKVRQHEAIRYGILVLYCINTLLTLRHGPFQFVRPSITPLPLIKENTCHTTQTHTNQPIQTQTHTHTNKVTHTHTHATHT